MKISKFGPKALETQNSLLGSPSICHTNAIRNRLGHVPRAFKTLAWDRLSSRNVHCQQVPSTLANSFNGEAIDGFALQVAQSFGGFHPKLGRPRAVALTSCLFS
jgi:hypothetical protein